MPSPLPPAAPAPVAPAPPPPPRDYHAVRWFLSVVILKRLKQLTGSSLFANELDMRDWMAWPDDLRFDQADEVWFDYMADTGDDSRVMEAIGRHLFQPFPTADALLPRGQFLMIGGDTAYVVADQTTIWERVVAPFTRAIHAVAPPAPDDPPRPIVGVAGNHDYYDNLVGFNRMFRKRPPADVHPPASDHPAIREPLPLPGYHRVQDATFLRIRLPGWQLWGTDFWNEAVDYRQQAYFRPDGVLPPQNLILCTPTPPVVHGGYTASDTDKESYHRLLGPTFDIVERLGGSVAANPEDQRLLMLSGDTHHYERYVTSPSPGAAPKTICVVSGGGGAFTHPTETQLGALAPVLRYPALETSRTRVAHALGWALPTMFRAGLLWLVGGLLGALVRWTAPTRPVATLWPALEFWLLVGLGVAIAIGAHAITQWTQTQRKRSYLWRLRPPGRQPSPLYQRLRNTGLARALATRGILEDLGMILRIAALTSAITLPYMLRRAWLPGVSGDSLVFVGTAVVFVVALTVLAFSVGARELPGVRRAVVTALGGVHSGFQFALPLIAVLAGASRDGAIVLAGWLGFAILARWLYQRGTIAGIGLAVLWLAQGAALPILAWRHGLDTAAISAPGWRDMLAGFVAGALIAPLQFSWYLLVAGSFDGHNNEIGTALRSTQHKQWIRFHVTRQRVTGYVIAIDDPAGLAKGDTAPRLLDVFTLEAAPDRATLRE